MRKLLAKLERMSKEKGWCLVPTSLNPGGAREQAGAARSREESRKLPGQQKKTGSQKDYFYFQFSRLHSQEICLNDSQMSLCTEQSPCVRAQRALCCQINIPPLLGRSPLPPTPGKQCWALPASAASTFLNRGRVVGTQTVGGAAVHAREPSRQQGGPRASTVCLACWICDSCANTSP